VTDSALIVLPAGIPWVLAAVVALLDGRRRWVGRLAALGLGASFVSVVALALRALNEGPVEVVVGGWPAGVGIVLRADVLGTTFAAVSVGEAVHAWVSGDAAERAWSPGDEDEGDAG